MRDGGYFDCYKQIRKQYGRLGLWKGFSACLIRAFYANAIGFYTYEISKDLILRQLGRSTNLNWFIQKYIENDEVVTTISFPHLLHDSHLSSHKYHSLHSRLLSTKIFNWANILVLRCNVYLHGCLSLQNCHEWPRNGN